MSGVFFEIDLFKEYSPHFHMFYYNYPKSSNLANRLLQLKIKIDHRWEKRDGKRGMVTVTQHFD